MASQVSIDTYYLQVAVPSAFGRVINAGFAGRRLPRTSNHSWDARFRPPPQVLGLTCHVTCGP